MEVELNNSKELEFKEKQKRDKKLERIENSKYYRRKMKNMSNYYICIDITLKL